MLSVITPNVTYKLFVLIVVMLRAVRLTVIMLSVVVPHWSGIQPCQRILDQGLMLFHPESLSGNTKGGIITVPFTSCLTGLD